MLPVHKHGVSRAALLPKGRIFQLLGAPGIPWLVAASFLSLPLWSRGLLLGICLLSGIIKMKRATIIEPTRIIWDDVISHLELNSVCSDPFPK